MALYSPQPTGSGKLTPVWPDLVLRFSTDGYGLVFEDTTNNFLLVWNADYQDRAIEYSPGLFTPTLVAHTATTQGSGAAGGLINPGPSTWDFTKATLPFNFEVDLYPTAASPYPFPANYDVSSFRDDTAYVSHRTGAGRRSATWPPLRGMRYHPDPVAQQKAWASTFSWCMDQLHRPLAHLGIGGAFSIPLLTACTNDWQWNAGDANRQWGYNREQISFDIKTNKNQSWNAFDGAHNESHVQFALACAGHPLGVALIWLLYSWYVQGTRPSNRCFSSSYFTGLFDQDRSAYHGFMLILYSSLVGFDWADPDVIKNWCGGLLGFNGGKGWKPREALNHHFRTFAGPYYLGGGADAHYIQLRLNPPPGYDEKYRPHRGCKTDFLNWTYNGTNYRRVFGQDRAFQRYMGAWMVPEIVRAHDYLQALDPTEFLLNELDAPILKDFARHHAQYVLDTGLVRQGVGSHGFAVRTMMFDHPSSLANALAMPVGFESKAALEAALADALVCEPDWINEDTGPGHEPNHPWVYPGTDGDKPWHIFAYEFPTFERGVTKWLLITGARINLAGSTDTECRATGPAAYAFAFGYDTELQGIIDRYAIISDPSQGDPKDYEIVWRKKEIAENQLNRSPTPCTTVGVNVPPTIFKSSVSLKTSPCFVTTAAVLGSYVLAGSVSKTPAAATAVAIRVDPTYSVDTTLPPGSYRPQPAFAVGVGFVAGVVQVAGSTEITPPPATAVAVTDFAGFPIDTPPNVNVRTPKLFCTTQTLLGDARLGSVSKTPNVLFAVAEAVPRGYSISVNEKRYTPAPATARALSVSPSYTVKSGSFEYEPEPAFVVCHAFLPGGGTDVVTDPVVKTPLPCVAIAVAVDPLISEATSVVVTTYTPAPAFVTCAAILGSYVVTAGSIQPPSSTAVAGRVDPTYRLSRVTRSPAAAFAIPASAQPSFEITESRVPENVQEVGVEIADEQATEVRV